MNIDLHSHTYYSDGKFSPREVIDGASQAGIRVLAITDHDNTAGAVEAVSLAQAAGIELVPGIELTTRWPEARLPREDVNVDLLGYFFDLGNAEFQAYQRASLNDIHQRMADCCDRLTRRGYPIQLSDLFAENPRYAGSTQLVQAILRKRHAPTWKEAARLMDSVWLTARETPFTIQAAIQQIHLAGGAAILAHPSIVRPEGQQITEAWLGRLVDAGLDGIEIYHRRLDEAARAHFLRLAQRFDLLTTGGSDMHGWSRGIDELGTQPVTATVLAELRSRAAMHRGQPK